MKRWSLPITCLLLGVLAGGVSVAPMLHGQAPIPNNPQPVVAVKEPTSYRELAKQVLPAVVSIEAIVKGKPKKQRPPDAPFDEGPGAGFGSGFLVDPTGVILTNNHVVEGVEQVSVLLTDGRKFVSKSIRGDRKTDLAVVLLDLKGKAPLPFLELGDSEEMEIGDRVLAFGAPFGLTGSVTHGIVSAKGRSGLSVNTYEDFLQTDAAINPGNSGGPLVNLDGKVIGINAAIKSRNGGFSGVGLAVASNLAKTVVKGLVTDGVVRRGYLGISLRDLPADEAEQLGLGKLGGVGVGDIYEKTPAAKSGLKTGDVITAINGRAIKDGRVLQTVVVSLPLNQVALVQVLRGGQPLTLKITIEEQPATFGAK